MEKFNPTHIGRDIAVKSADDVSAAILRNIALCDALDDRAWVALFSASAALASATGAFRVLAPQATPHELVSTMFVLMEPLAMGALERMGDRS